VRFVPIDFETTSLAEGMARGGFDARAPAFISWLGVMIYLSREAVDAVFAFARSLPQGSEIVFSFVPPVDPEQAGSPTSLAARAAEIGEPWRTRFEPDELREMLRGMGFREVCFLTPGEADARWFRGRTDGLRPSPRIRVGSAVV
jgi:methyltransferase (TIGR00027 family)